MLVPQTPAPLRRQTSRRPPAEQTPQRCRACCKPQLHGARTAARSSLASRRLRRRSRHSLLSLPLSLPLSRLLSLPLSLPLSRLSSLLPSRLLSLPRLRLRSPWSRLLQPASLPQ
jgi:hypothetical protein